MKIKVLQIIPQFVRGGAETVALNYARFLDKEKFEVVTASCVEGGELERDFATAGARMWVGSRQKFGGRIAVWRELGKMVKTWQPDIIHTHLFGGDLVGWILKKYFGSKAPWIVTIHNREQGFSKLRMIIWKIILRRADKIIAVSGSTAEYAREYLAVDLEKMITINNGIDLAPWFKVATIAADDSKLRLATVGRLTKQKGHVYLLLALAKLKCAWQWEVFGSGEEEGKLKNLARKLKIADNIIWQGTVSDLPRQLKTVDVIAAPSLWEGLSLAVMEMMAAGKTVVASAAAGDELIIDNKTGLIIRPEITAEFVKTLEALAVDKNLCRQLGENARVYAREHFAVEKNVMVIEKIYVEQAKP